MTITKIKYEKLFPIGQFCNERIGMEAELRDGDIYHECFAELKQEVESFHKQTNPHLYENGLNVIGGDGLSDWRNHQAIILTDYNTGEEKITTPHEERVGDIKTQIQNASSLKVLESFKLIVKNHPEFTEAYNDKLKQFS